jgi:phenylalanyl-tRNA synthetase beta chain
MRTTLAGGLLEVLRTNLAHREERVRIVEIGRCFERHAGGEHQPLRIGGLAYGDAVPEQWGAPRRSVDLFDIMADLAALAAPCTIATQRAAHPALHPGRSAAVLADGRTVGWLGELHPRVAKHFELPRSPVLFELELAALADVPVPAASPVSRLPRVRRDMAVVVDEQVPMQDILAALDAARPAGVETIRLFDVYRGPSIGAHKKSLAILVVMQDTERTLTDAEIDAVMTQLVQIVIDRFGGALRQ